MQNIFIRRAVRCAALCVSAIFLLAGARCAHPRAAPPDASTQPASVVAAHGGRVVCDLAYVAHAHAQQKLDVYAPADAHGAAVLMFVHGGEWTRHDKSEVDAKPLFFTQHGVVFVSVNYRLSGTAPHPAQVDDVAAAVRWVHDHAGEFGGDPEKIVLMGHSAGCHLVTLAGLDPRPLAKVNLKPADLRGVVSWSGGAFDLVQKVKDGGMYAGYIRKTFGDDERTWRDASPIHHVGDARPMPRFLFASAEKDKPASIEAGRRMVTMIRDAGGNAEATMLPGRDHNAANRELGAPGDSTGVLLLGFIVEATSGVPSRETDVH